jgi:hypothetical protein
METRNISVGPSKDLEGRLEVAGGKRTEFEHTARCLRAKE